jgi:FkbM family methyltransferase
MRKIFLDCGANRGQSIIQAKKQFGDDFEIHSFEAVPILYDKLIEKWKHDSKVYLYNNAVWDKKDKVKIYLSLGWSDSSTLYLEKKDRPITTNLYNEIEYHKLDWGNIQREFNEKWFNFNNKFYYINKEKFNQILKLKSHDFFNIKINDFYKNMELEELLI